MHCIFIFTCRLTCRITPGACFPSPKTHGECAKTEMPAALFKSVRPASECHAALSDGIRREADVHERGGMHGMWHSCVSDGAWLSSTSKTDKVLHRYRHSAPVFPSTHPPICFPPCLHLLFAGLAPNAQPKQRLNDWRLRTGEWGLNSGWIWCRRGTGWEMPSTRPAPDGTAELRAMPRLARIAQGELADYS